MDTPGSTAFLVAGTLLGAATLAASAIPARRATRIDPGVALQADSAALDASAGGSDWRPERPGRHPKVMAAPDPILINDSLSIPRAELEFRATRSGGPGGQHVNTSATRVQLTWNVAESPSLSDAQRARILTRLATRIDERGVLQLTASGSRSQYQNRVEVTERFAALLAQALKVPKPRKKTRPSKKVREARLQSKRRRSETKRRRRDVDPEE